MDARALETLLAVTLVAALAPVIVAALPGPKIPQVVILILAGILIGPQGLGLGDTTSVQLLANIGLGFLFLLAGYELDPRQLKERSGRLAMVGWAASALLAVAAVGVLAHLNLVHDFVPIGLALTTTALGTLLPILQDNDMLAGRFGRYILAAGAVGELFPIIAISLFLTKRNQFVALGSLLAVGAAALLLTTAPRIVGKRRLDALVRQGQRATAQSTLRWSIVLLVLLLVAAEKFGDDVVLGAMLAGMVLRSWTRRMDMEVHHLEDKLDAVGYGIFIPVFFVASGMTLDVRSILANPSRLFIFLGLLLLVRGVPSLLVYLRVLPLRQRIEMTFITATTMPLLIALAAIGLSDGVMIPANAAALVGAGVLSVLIFPVIAAMLHRRGRPARPGAGDAVPGGPGPARLGRARDDGEGRGEGVAAYR
jgi:Kef-type K+ transport system membrane component KefB